jgi:hypothetical protein
MGKRAHHAPTFSYGDLAGHIPNVGGDQSRFVMKVIQMMWEYLLELIGII